MITRSVFGKSVQGASHKKSNKECQDHLKFIPHNNNRTYIMAVADGHGSASCPFSKTGSEVAVKVFCDVMDLYLKVYRKDRNQLLTFLNREADTRVAQSIESEWKRRIWAYHKKCNREIPYTGKGIENLWERKLWNSRRARKIEIPANAGCFLDESAIYRQYGTTLLGLMITDSFLFSFRIGDGDIIYVDDSGAKELDHSEKILGVETHSLSRENAWEKAVTQVRRIEDPVYPNAIMMMTDGFANSYPSENAFAGACRDYFGTIRASDVDAVKENLEAWLNETSALGCGDDITWLCCYTKLNDESAGDSNERSN